MFFTTIGYTLQFASGIFIEHSNGFMEKIQKKRYIRVYPIELYKI